MIEMPPIRATSMLRLQLLGPLALTLNGNTVEPGYAKLRALLAWLAMEGTPQRRDRLAELFWPDKGQTVARQNLRRALFNLKTALGDAAFLLTTPDESVALAREGIDLDVAEFLRDDAADVEALERLAALYRGPFMADFSLPECSDFEEWLLAQRELLHRRALLLADQLAARHEQRGDLPAALRHALRYTDLEPWEEAGQRRAMRLYAISGSPGAALSHYDSFCARLKDELGLLPHPETRQLAARIRDGEMDARAPAPLAATPFRPVAERRQVTVLFCELPVALFDDPDEALAQLRKPQEECAERVRRFGGHIVQTHGGSLLAYFGYPQAREDAARRAVEAALDVTRVPLHGVEVRACLHTGLIVTGGDDSMPDTAGRTTKLAMRLRHGAGAHRVVISGDTLPLVRGWFEGGSLGSHAFAGFPQPVELFAIERATGARSRLDAAPALTPLAGRTAEIAALRAAWQVAQRGARRVLLIQGEAGIGKSRLLRALRESLGEAPYLLRELRCFPEHSQSPFHPLIAIVEEVLGIEPEEAPEQKFERLTRHMEAHFTSLAADAIPLLADLLSLPVLAPFRRPELTPQKLKERTGELLLQVVQVNATRQPVLLIIEDLHWADPSTLELLDRFVSQPATGAVLALLTARPGFTPTWPPELVTRLPLAHLDRTAVTSMIASLRADLASGQIDRIVERTDGVPLFVEELVRFGAWEGAATIPATLHDLLAARMDTLGPAKHVAQLAATLGREFEVDWLNALHVGGPGDLAAHLRSLQEAGLISPMDARLYQFKHALIQEAAYQSQSRQDRQAAHRRIAAMLQRDHAAVVASQPELLAQHLGAAGDFMHAAESWLQAGRRAVLHSANAEAEAHFTNGLKLLEALPESDARDHLEAALSLQLGTALIVSRGYGSLDARHAFMRAQELSEKCGDGVGMFSALWGRWLGASSCEDYVHAAELGDQLLALAQRSGDRVALQQACLAVGDCHLWRGQQEEACRWFERGTALYAPAHHVPMITHVGENVRISIGSQMVWSLWLAGYPDRAAEEGQRTLALARELDHPYSIGYIQTHRMILARWNRDVPEMRRLAEEVLALSHEHGFHIWLVSGLAFRGLALAYQGDAAGVALVRQSVGIVHAVMSGVEAFFIAALGEALGALGHHEEALTVLDQALAAVDAKATHFWESEILRLKGEYLLALSPARAEEAQACFARALAACRAQGARSLQLRVAISLARLKPVQGGALLQAVYDGFQEGFSTSDLREARSLLDELA